MAFCNSCGAVLEGDSRFCAKCGADQTAKASGAPAPRGGSVGPRSSHALYGRQGRFRCRRPLRSGHEERDDVASGHRRCSRRVLLLHALYATPGPPAQTPPAQTQPGNPGQQPGGNPPEQQPGVILGSNPEDIRDSSQEDIRDNSREDIPGSSQEDIRGSNREDIRDSSQEESGTAAGRESGQQPGGQGTESGPCAGAAIRLEGATFERANPDHAGAVAERLERDYPGSGAGVHSVRRQQPAPFAVDEQSSKARCSRGRPSPSSHSIGSRGTGRDQYEMRHRGSATGKLRTRRGRPRSAEFASFETGFSKLVSVFFPASIRCERSGSKRGRRIKRMAPGFHCAGDMCTESTVASMPAAAAGRTQNGRDKFAQGER